MLRVLCLALAFALGCNAAQFAGQPSTPGVRECKLGSNGQQTCGFNCKLGSGGSWYCASTPDGQCALNATGSWTCP